MRGIFIFLVVILFISCSTRSNSPQAFYSTFSGWDIKYIPIIEPFRASSIDGGTAWYIDGKDIRQSANVGGTIHVQEFGVSGNYIFGKNEGQWFLLDTRTSMYAAYNTKEELLGCLSDLHIPVKPIKTCTEYYRSLQEEGRCYWFPADGETYNGYIDVKPVDPVSITVISDTVNGPRLQAGSRIKYHRNNIYFFDVKLQGNESDLLYLAINYAPQFKVTKDTMMPVFIDDKQFDITLYTPYLVAQEKGIPESKRLYVKKMITIEE